MENTDAVILKQVGIQFTRVKKRRLLLGDFLSPRFRLHGEKEKIWALKNINLNIKKGEHVGIIGANGAGKSTLLKVICGVFNPTEGNVAVQGKIVPILELGDAFEPLYTGRENIYLYGALMGISYRRMNEYVEQIVEFSELQEAIDTPVVTYSSGMKSRLAFSVATITRPDILVLDEALTTGDKNFRGKSYRRIMELINSETTVLFVSHNEEELKKVCTRGIILDHGHLIADGKLDDILKVYSLRKASWNEQWKAESR